MGLMDVFKTKEFKQQISELEQENARVKSLMTPELKEADALSKKIAELSDEKNLLENNVARLKQSDAELSRQIDEKQSQIISFDEQLLVQDFGLYEPRFDFSNSTQFKDKLKKCRQEQKEFIKAFNERAKQSSWTVNGSVAKGRQMVSQISRLLMRAYNGECDEIVRKVKATNVDKSIEQIYKIASSVNKQCTVIGSQIDHEYQALKEQEVRLAYEYALQKEKEREEIRELKEQEREAKKLAKEIAAERKKLEKEKRQYLNAYEDIVKRLRDASDEEKTDLIEKADELKEKLDDVDIAVQNVDYREANQKAGFVYIISNVGSFGEGVYKIGMTRRLDPMERVRELGDASVPFNFDVHALIFCDDAPALEAALHREFEDRKVNIVNTRREFFRVSLSEIEEVVKRNYDKTVEFTEVPEAYQFRTSEKLREQGIYEYRK